MTTVRSAAGGGHEPTRYAAADEGASLQRLVVLATATGGIDLVYGRVLAMLPGSGMPGRRRELFDEDGLFAAGDDVATRDAHITVALGDAGPQVVEGGASWSRPAPSMAETEHDLHGEPYAAHRRS